MHFRICASGFRDDIRFQTWQLHATIRARRPERLAVVSRQGRLAVDMSQVRTTVTFRRQAFDCACLKICVQLKFARELKCFQCPTTYATGMRPALAPETAWTPCTAELSSEAALASPGQSNESVSAACFIQSSASCLLLTVCFSFPALRPLLEEKGVANSKDTYLQYPVLKNIRKY